MKIRSYRDIKSNTTGSLRGFIFDLKKNLPKNKEI